MKVDQNSHSCPHVKLQPGKPGKVFWLSGPPGAGKSTTCQLMAREKDFVFYEGDATSSFVNPFQYEEGRWAVEGGELLLTS